MKRPRGAGEGQHRPIVDLARILKALIRRYAELEAALGQRGHQATVIPAEASRAFDGIERAIAAMAATTLPEAAIQILIARGYAVQLRAAHEAASSDRIQRISRLLESALPVVANAAGTDLAAGIARRYAPSESAPEAPAAAEANGVEDRAVANSTTAAAPTFDPTAAPADVQRWRPNGGAPAHAATAGRPDERAHDRAAIWRRIGEAREAQADLLEALDAYELADVIDVSGDHARAGAHYQRALGIATALGARDQLPPAQAWLVDELAERLGGIGLDHRITTNNRLAGTARTQAHEPRMPH